MDFVRIARPNVVCPILRKDFIVDEYQLFQAREIGANAVLLIAADLTKAECKQLAKTAHELGLETLLETHSEPELEYVGEKGEYPRVVQEKSDGYECDAYVTNIQNSATIGFKYFDYKNLKSVGIYTRAYIHGEFEVRTKIDGEVLGTIKVEGSNVWEYGECAVKVPDGAGALYLTFKGTGKGELKSVVLNA